MFLVYFSQISVIIVRITAINYSVVYLEFTGIRNFIQKVLTKQDGIILVLNVILGLDLQGR